MLFKYLRAYAEGPALDGASGSKGIRNRVSSIENQVSKVLGLKSYFFSLAFLLVSEYF
jgi:hypothetical protein